MNPPPSRRPLRRQTLALIAAGVPLAALAVWLLLRPPATGKQPAGGEAPSRSAVINEESLNVITLTEKAEERLALKTAEVERREVPRVRIVGGELMVIPGRDVIVAAPFAGRLQAPQKGVPRPGQQVKQNHPDFHLPSSSSCRC
jgi:hypothetical protein